MNVYLRDEWMKKSMPCTIQNSVRCMHTHMQKQSTLFLRTNADLNFFPTTTQTS